MNKNSFSIDDNEVYYTKTEQLIINQLVLGKSNAQISKHFNCREKTVKGHVTNILNKAKCESRALFISQFYSRVVEALRESKDYYESKANELESKLNEISSRALELTNLQNQVSAMVEATSKGAPIE